MDAVLADLQKWKNKRNTGGKTETEATRQVEKDDQYQDYFK